ncbi:sugar transferase [uncultured Friedmanniella sp.]|uniref:sugar transferase n=1 Tax=uncultured Friedmanniella sp. TaxID=335381 RepID=UPI0035CAD00A
MTDTIRQLASTARTRNTEISRRSNWRRAYASRLAVTDILVLIWAILGAALISVRLFEPLVTPAWMSPLRVNYFEASAALIVVWTFALAAVGSRDHRKLGTGMGEYKAVLQSALLVLVLIALVSFAFRIDISRGLILLALPAAMVGLLLSRAIWRRWLRLHRRRGEFSARVLLVGSSSTTSHIAADLRRHPAAGYHVVGALVTSGAHGSALLGDIPILGTVDRLLDAVTDCDADTVVVTDGHNLEPAKLRELSWSLEPGRQHLVMAPSLTDIAGPRIHARPVAGLPLVHVETPRYEGADRFVKRAFDVCASGGLLLLGSVPLLAVAAIIKLSSPGDLFFSHVRIGKNGEPFRMLKFRSMVADADSRLADLLKEQGTEMKPLFKIENDPRITPIGRFIRRYSIDEIPQLINVLKGDMSLVGPRPQVAKEVALYDHAAARRLNVSPGMTGLWQVSGRSNLDWEESVRLDLFYVENWSLTTDVFILARTVRAVLASDGAV